MIEVEVMIAVSPRAGQTHAFANADVVIFVAEVRVGVFPARRETEDARDLGCPRQRRQSPEIGQISGREQDRLALAVGARDLAFKLAVAREIAAEQPRTALTEPLGLVAGGGC